MKSNETLLLGEPNSNRLKALNNSYEDDSGRMFFFLLFFHKSQIQVVTLLFFAPLFDPTLIQSALLQTHTHRIVAKTPSSIPKGLTDYGRRTVEAAREHLKETMQELVCEFNPVVHLSDVINLRQRPVLSYIVTDRVSKNQIFGYPESVKKWVLMAS